MQTLFITKGKTESTKRERDGGESSYIPPYSILILANFIFLILINFNSLSLFFLQFIMFSF